MFDPLLTLIAAKAKAVGLVAGTAMVTAALAGGGAVAMTAVSHDGTVHEETVAEEVVPDVVLDGDVATDTPTVGIDPTDGEGGEGEDPTEGEEGVEEDGVTPALPADFVCDETKNHGQNVSAYARSLEKGPGRGQKVSAVAQSDCGKKSDDTVVEEPLTVESDDAEVEETEEAEAPAPAKAEKKAARAEGKTQRKAAQTERKAGKSSAKASGGKGNGKNK